MPRLLRPTIPVADWKVAVDLAATKAIQKKPGVPAYGCHCNWCENWRASASSVLPSEILDQLERLGVQVHFPNDLYAFEEVEGGANCRVVFHIVGKLLSGPNVWHEDPKLGKLLWYQALRSTPYLSLAIYPCQFTDKSVPPSGSYPDGRLLQVDFRLFVPLARSATDV